MNGKRYTEEKTVFALRQAESGVPVAEICRKMVDPDLADVDYVAEWRKGYHLTPEHDPADDHA